MPHTLNIDWNSKSFPLVNGQRFRTIHFGRNMTYADGTFRCSADGQEYGFFRRVGGVSDVIETFPLEVLDDGRFHTYYVVSLDYDRVAECSVHFVFIDTVNKRIYESSVFRKQRDDLIIDVGMDKSLTISWDEERVVIGPEAYAAYVAAARQCAVVSAHLGPL